MIHEAFATDPTPDLPLNVGFGSLADIYNCISDVLGHPAALSGIRPVPRDWKRNYSLFR